MDKEKSFENGVVSYPKLDSSVENSDAGERDVRGYIFRMCLSDFLMR